MRTGALEKLGKHWLPVVEYEVWSYVRSLQISKAPATKASSLVEGPSFLLVPAGGGRL